MVQPIFNQPNGNNTTVEKATVIKETLIHSVRRMRRWIFRLIQAKNAEIQLRAEGESHPKQAVSRGLGKHGFIPFAG
jgi:hypothetical protein